MLIPNPDEPKNGHTFGRAAVCVVCRRYEGSFQPLLGFIDGGRSSESACTLPPLGLSPSTPPSLSVLIGDTHPLINERPFRQHF